MRILLISKWVDGATKGTFHHSGEWSDTFELACAFADLSHEVGIVTPEVFPKHKKRFEKEFGKVLKREKIPHFYAPVLLSFGLNEGVFQWKMHWAILKAVKEFKPDVIQFMQLTPTFIHLFTKIPIFFYGIVISYQYPKLEDDTRERLSNLKHQRNIKNLLANSLFFALVKLLKLENFEELTRIGNLILKHKKGYKQIKVKTHDKEKVFFVHKGVNILKARHSRLLSQAILFVGMIIYRKGIFDLIKAFSGVSRYFPNAKLLIIGDGPQELVARIKTFIKQSKIKATLLRSIGYNQKWGIYEKADIFCLPTYADASPAVILEAMVSGLPIITTHQADPPFKNGQDAILVNAGDVDAISTALVKLLKNPKYAQKLATSSFKKAHLYSWEKQAAKILNLYTKKLKLKATE